MSRADDLLAALAQGHPAAAGNLSPAGRALFYPHGIPAQSAEARGCRIDATIGQVTDDDGHAMVLPALRAAFAALDLDQATLYAPQGGRMDLREAWRAHVRADSPLGPGPLTLPVATSGLTHGLFLVASLFARPGGPLLLPDPCWGNYVATFQRIFGAQPRSWRLLRPDPRPGAVLDVQALDAAIQALDAPATLILNFPSNPVGYSPTEDEAQAIVAAVARAPVPLVVVCDDAYQGMVWTPEARRASLFHELSRLNPERVLAAKVDGATKELFYFGGRVGFLSFGAEGAAAAALEDKIRAAARASISTVSSTSQAVLAAALREPTLPAQQAEVRAVLAARFSALREALLRHRLAALPFNSGMFAVLPVPGDPEALRRRLLAESIGVIALPEAGALRLSYGSVPAARMDELVAAIARQAR